MPRPRTILLVQLAFLIVAYVLGLSGNAWYLETGNTYFHFLGGLGVALLVASYYSTEFAKLSQPLRFFCLIGITMGIGVLWEFHEYLLQYVFGSGHRFQGDLADTMLDLLMDTLGGIVVGISGARK